MAIVCTIRAWVAAVAVVVAAGCGSDESKEVASCDDLAGRVYLSEQLLEVGETLQDIALGHWELQLLDDGEVQSVQSDVGMGGRYSCADGKVKVKTDAGATVVFGVAATRIEFNPYDDGETLPYRRVDNVTPAAECADIAGTTFANTDSYAVFGEYGVILKLADESEPVAGRFDCTLGELSLYVPLAEGATPQPAHHVTNVPRPHLSFQGHTFYTSNGNCPGEPGPVCGLAAPVCTEAGCPPAVYRTFASECAAIDGGSLMARKNACDVSLEGLSVADTHCGETDTPVCAAATTTRLCDTAPCPARIHITFECAGAALVAGAPVVAEGECGALDGEVVHAPLSGECPAEESPVCALALATQTCEGDDCGTHRYHTFANECLAMLAPAQYAFSGACGVLENVATDGAPPIKIADPVGTHFLIYAGAPGEAAIEGDLLTVSRGRPCIDDHMEMVVGETFSGDADTVPELPFQFVSTAKLLEALSTYLDLLVPPPCLVQQTARYDLRPLRAVYDEAFGAEHGAISLPGLGVYEF